MQKRRGSRTLDAGIVWLNVCLGDAAVLDDEGVSLAAISAEDGGPVEGEFQCGGEARGRITEEADLGVRVSVMGEGDS